MEWFVTLFTFLAFQSLGLGYTTFVPQLASFSALHMLILLFFLVIYRKVVYSSVTNASPPPEDEMVRCILCIPCISEVQDTIPVPQLVSFSSHLLILFKSDQKQAWFMISAGSRWITIPGV